ncbi:MAG: alpha/beta hydrolase [Hyphomicrobiaceae bacterium]|nr:alpha/beta hydrolase [Hyphomicrobiaceae bacterium]
MNMSAPQPQTNEWTELVFTSHDGLRLAARHYSAYRSVTSNTVQKPLICLSGMAGNSSEFHDLALFLSTHGQQPRDVYALDYRGRGNSQADPGSANYTSYVELRDILDFLIAFDIHHFDVLGSSRGGINTMLLATVRPAAIGRIILNDLGPVLEPDGLARLLGHLENMPLPASWGEACDLMRSMYQLHFPALDDEDWRVLAGRYFKEEDGQLSLTFDKRLGLGGRHLDLQKTLPDMWGQYLALFRFPLLIIRGEHSDMLSCKTLEHMHTLHWNAKAVTVPGQGHAPLLRDKASMQTIQAFLAEKN